MSRIDQLKNKALVEGVMKAARTTMDEHIDITRRMVDGNYVDNEGLVKIFLERQTLGQLLGAAMEIIDISGHGIDRKN